MEYATMPRPRRVTVALPDEIVSAADELAATRACSRSALVENALRWYLRVQDLAWDEASAEEIEAIRAWLGARIATLAA